MRNLIAAEWLKLSRRPMAWILLAIFLLQLALFLSVIFLVLALADGLLTHGEPIALLAPEQIDQFRRQISFPGIFGEVLGQVNAIGGICAVILAAGAMGSEYTWGTLRVQLARQPNRGRYLAAKIITLLLVVVVAICIALLVGSALALLYGAVLGNLGSLSARDLLLLPLGIARSLYVMLPYLMFAVAMSIIGRSSMAGIAGGLIFLVLDASTGTPTLLANINNPLIEFFYHMLIQPNINRLVVINRSAYGLDPSLMMNLDPSRLPSTLQATLVVGIYSLLFAGYAYYMLTRRDVTGAS